MATDDIINKYLGVETEDSKPESKPPAVVRKDDKDTDEDDSDPERSYFKTDVEDDDWGFSPKKKEKQVLDEFTTLFKGL